MKKVPIPTMGANTERPTTKVMPHVQAAHDAVEGVDMVRLNVKIPSAVHRAFKTRAAEENRTIQEMILELMTHYLMK